MRELKFRAWDKDLKRYFYDIAVYPNNVAAIQRHNIESMMLEAEYGATHWTELDENAVIEQYTGLKDKNGKEIYEGDIIQEEIDFNSKMTDGVFTYVVEWDSDTLCYGLRGNDNSIHDELWEVNTSVEVIGNIHENPELLEDD